MHRQVQLPCDAPKLVAGPTARHQPPASPLRRDPELPPVHGRHFSLGGGGSEGHLQRPPRRTVSPERPRSVSPERPRTVSPERPRSVSPERPGAFHHVQQTGYRPGHPPGPGLQHAGYHLGARRERFRHRRDQCPMLQHPERRRRPRGSRHLRGAGRCAELGRQSERWLRHRLVEQQVRSRPGSLRAPRRPTDRWRSPGSQPSP